MAPPHSYIHANDFPSVAALAEYLDYLSANQTAFMSYFWWKDLYRLDTTRSVKLGMCELCKMLNDGTLPEKSYDLKDWWWEQSKCQMNPEWT